MECRSSALEEIERPLVELTIAIDAHIPRRLP
jgi:hypothetical protein